jgi:hypothetical protein
MAGLEAEWAPKTMRMLIALHPSSEGSLPGKTFAFGTNVFINRHAAAGLNKVENRNCEKYNRLNIKTNAKRL